VIKKYIRRKNFLTLIQEKDEYSNVYRVVELEVHFHAFLTFILWSTYYLEDILHTDWLGDLVDLLASLGVVVKRELLIPLL